MNEQLTSRFKGTAWSDLEPQIILVGGVGSIGSWVTFFLSRTNKHKIFVVDNDVVEDSNIGGQFFNKKNINFNKVYSIVRNSADFGSVSEIVPAKLLIEEVSGLDTFPIIVTAFDNIDARKHCFKEWQKNPDKKLFIDGRLLAEQYEVYFVTPGEREDKYKETLFEQGEAEEIACANKCTTHFAAGIAFRIVQGFTSFITNDHYKEELYELPFRVFEYGPLFDIKIE